MSREDEKHCSAGDFSVRDLFATIIMTCSMALAIGLGTWYSVVANGQRSVILDEIHRLEKEMVDMRNDIRELRGLRIEKDIARGDGI